MSEVIDQVKWRLQHNYVARDRARLEELSNDYLSHVLDQLVSNAESFVAIDAGLAPVGGEVALTRNLRELPGIMNFADVVTNKDVVRTEVIVLHLMEPSPHRTMKIRERLESEKTKIQEVYRRWGAIHFEIFGKESTAQPRRIRSAQQLGRAKQ
jgi:hypothetical protein